MQIKLQWRQSYAPEAQRILGGGCRVAGSFTAQSGFVFPLSSGGANSINGLPDRVPGVPLEVPKELQRWYDDKASVSLPSGRIITPLRGARRRRTHMTRGKLNWS
ncbi:MAG TPA: hypothetical protein VFV58_00015 [Blastocatellia bacterium]|nr:hypothetical protein [Blastocatellia bacterium]